MGLADNKCVPCRGGVPPLPNDRVQALLKELGRGWALKPRAIWNGSIRLRILPRRWRT